MKDMDFCQSCAMPMNGDEKLHGNNSDGSVNKDYCVYCFKDGEFTADIGMDEMIEFCVDHVIAANKDMTEDEARSMMREFFPKLKRWQGK